MFSKSCEYGLRAVLFIAQSSLSNTKVSLVEIAQEIDSPSAFTAKILQQLSKANIIASTKGPTGGFLIAKENLKKQTLAGVVAVLDGDKVYTGCGLGLKQCDDQFPCPVHDQFVKVRTELKTMLENTNLYDLAIGIDNGITWLKRA
ncbi:HTH-type transcriptional regulator CymR [Polaribacter huanghezhanensis]|uniref:RrF2 family transcriptional regulator n=1 Tax=Polaribacter huanghezhanensis TaxID=1354726 RepID=UPI00264A1CDE|nr:Rrf2 family transcriptional regulator [Polaribacter huanghezhanensis]WKD85785.1 HTH-type transcriptional regulator CymR [Polaribacter huanghezhanensis]